MKCHQSLIFRLPLEVKFSGEEAEDHGGPRKEFFRLILILIKENYFNGRLKEEVADEYIMCGTLMGLSMIQHGNIPQFLGEDILDELVYSSAPSICLSQLRTGLQSVGIFQLMSNLPQFLQLFMPSNSGALTVKELINLLPPCFSEEGTNDRYLQKNLYNSYIRYVREVSAGKRKCGQVTVTLEHILQFTSGTNTEPLLGFEKPPGINFVKCMESGSFLPISNTCSNALTLPYPCGLAPWPSDAELFNLYDMRFTSSYFGKV